MQTTGTHSQRHLANNGSTCPVWWRMLPGRTLLGRCHPCNISAGQLFFSLGYTVESPGEPKHVCGQASSLGWLKLASLEAEVLWYFWKPHRWFSCAARCEKHSHRVTLKVFGLEPSWSGASVEQPSKTSLAPGKSAFLPVMTHHRQSLRCWGALESTWFSALWEVLCEMPFFKLFCPKHRYSYIYFVKAWDLVKTAWTKCPSEMSFTSVEAEVGNTHPPTSHIMCHLVAEDGEELQVLQIWYKNQKFITLVLHNLKLKA